MSRRVALITGAHGTIGRYVASALAKRNWTVVGIGHGRWRDGEMAAHGLSSWKEDDVSLEALRGLKLRPDLVIHCAGSGAVGPSVTAPHADFRRTVDLTAEVLEFVRADCPGATLVYPSSAAVYGIADALPMREEAPLRPTSPYGAHKKIAEDLVREHARLFGLKAAVVRLFSIYGEGFRKQLLWDACLKLKANELEFFGTGKETRDWLHAEDAAELLIRAADHASRDCPVLNGGSGQSVAVQAVVAELSRLMNCPGTPSFCGTQRPGDPMHYHADMRQAFGWGWRPAIAWQDGFSRYVAWFKKEHGLS